MSINAWRIGLNAHLLSTSETYRGAGISWYIINLLKNLAQVSPDFLNYCTFLHDRPFKDDPSSLRLHTSRLPTQRPAVRILWEQFIQPLALRRAFVNLIDNAIAYSVTGSVIAIVSCNDDGSVTLSVENHTSDLVNIDLEHLFDRFWRKDPTKQNGNHAGLGLPLVKALGDLLEIDIEVSLSPDSKFKVQLTFAKIDDSS